VTADKRDTPSTAQARRAPEISAPAVAPAAGAPDGEREPHFRLVSITAAKAPSGCAGSDWLVYRIAQGDNLITGYRQGDLQAVSAEVDRIVIGLNERANKPKKGARGRPGRPTAAAAAARASSDAPSSDD
jgi:hypothetical protein